MTPEELMEMPVRVFPYPKMPVLAILSDIPDSPLFELRLCCEKCGFDISKKTLDTGAELDPVADALADKEAVRKHYAEVHEVFPR